MTPAFKVAVVGPSRVGKTTLVTAILSETERMLAGSPVVVAMNEPTTNRVRRQRLELRRAIEAGEFNAAALAGNQSMFVYRVMLQSAGDAEVEIPFELLDFPGGWLDPEIRAANSEAVRDWPTCEAHINESMMLLVPIDAAVLMEAVTPAHRRAVPDLLGFEDVEGVARKWVTNRNMEEHRDEPAVLVLAPLKCEKYFDDNSGHGRDSDRLRAKVREKYAGLLDIIKAEAQDRQIRIIYAPIDTYGCVELMEARWPDRGLGHLDFEAHYRFRGAPPRISVKAAGAVMQEMCRCVVAGWDVVAKQAIEDHRDSYNHLLRRDLERKGFWRTVGYHVGGEAKRNRSSRQYHSQEITAGGRRRRQLQESVEKLAVETYDTRVEEW